MASGGEPTVTQLVAENRALSDELAQCQADKEFVWTLWKRLQVANPDVTQAISLVVQREKEKAELKDRKILEILRIKDDRIADLDQILCKQQDEIKEFVSRKHQVDEDNAVLQREIRSLTQEKQALQEQVDDKSHSRLVNSNQDINNQLLKNEQKHRKEAEYRVSELAAELEKMRADLRNVEQESNQDAEHRVSQVTEQLEKVQADLEKSQDMNAAQDAKIKSMKKELRQKRSTTELAEKHLTEEEDRLHQTEENLEQIKAEMKARQNELAATRKELSELQNNHSDTLEQVTGQSDIIRQLQKLQIDTQKVLKNQEEAHKLEVSSIQTMYTELQSRHNTTKQSEHQLQHQISKMQKDLQKAEKQRDRRSDTRNVGIQVNVVERQENIHTSRDKSDRGRTDEEVFNMAWDLQQSRGRRAASTPVKSSTHRRTRSLSPGMLSQRQAAHRGNRVSSRHDNGLRAANNYPHYEVASHMRAPSATYRHDKVDETEEVILSGSPPDDEEEDVKCRLQDPRADRKLADLRKLIKLKNKELDEMHRAHSRRHERLKVLQSNHNLLREQIKTYEAHESATSKQKKKKKLRRSNDPKALQREDSEAVWNELAYYKQQTADSLQERMNLEEELDCFKVQSSSDAVTIAELNRCLQQERQDLQEHLTQLRKVNKREEREREIIDDLKRKNKTLKFEREDLHAQRRDIAMDRTQLEKQIRVVKMELSQLRAESAKKDSVIYTLKKDIGRFRRKLRHRRHRAHTVGGVSLQRSPKQRQSFLNKSIQAMSQVFPDFDHDGWEETSDDSPQSSSDEITDLDPIESVSSLGQKIVASSAASTPRKNSKQAKRDRKRRGVPAGSISPRQQASVEKHLSRMARAYDKQHPVDREEEEDATSTSVSTQTDRGCTVRVRDTGVGDSSIGKDSEPTHSDASWQGRQHTHISVDKRTVATSPHISLSKLSHAISRDKKQPAHSVASLKQRVATLQNQVSVLRESKVSIQKMATEQSELASQLQEDLNQSNQRLVLSKQTVQRLQSELQQNQQEKKSLDIQLEAKKTVSDAIRHTETAWKQMESRMKGQSEEISRQTSVIKALKVDNETQRDTVKSLQDKINRMERDVTQKRSLIEDLKAKATAAEIQCKSEANKVMNISESLQKMTEVLERKKAEIESLRKQLSVMTNEKHQYEQQWMKTQADLTKKNHLVNTANARCNEAETTAAEIESAATNQLRALAQQTEGALQGANEKLKRSSKQVEEFNAFVKSLASELLHQVQDNRLLLRQQLLRPASSSADGGQTGDGGDSMSSRAQSIASDILDMSASDLAEFLKDEADEEKIQREQEEKEDERQDKKWTKRLEAVLEKPSGHELLRLILMKITEKDNIIHQVTGR